MLICDNCGLVIEDEDAPIVEDLHSIDTGIGMKIIHRETFLEDCLCGGSFVKATQCKLCGEYFWATSCFDAICDECLEENEYDSTQHAYQRLP